MKFNSQWASSKIRIAITIAVMLLIALVTSAAVLPAPTLAQEPPKVHPTVAPSAPVSVPPVPSPSPVIQTPPPPPPPPPAPKPTPKPRPAVVVPAAPAAPPAPAGPHYIHISEVTDSGGAQSAIDACQGPVEVTWPSDPTEIAQHNYCGGAWFTSLTGGDEVIVSGGTVAGTYVVNGARRYAAKGSSSSTLDGLGDLVLQTCVGNQLVLIGLSRA